MTVSKNYIGGSSQLEGAITSVKTPSNVADATPEATTKNPQEFTTNPVIVLTPKNEPDTQYDEKNFVDNFTSITGAISGGVSSIGNALGQATKVVKPTIKTENQITIDPVLRNSLIGLVFAILFRKPLMRLFGVKA